MEELEKYNIEDVGVGILLLKSLELEHDLYKTLYTKQIRYFEEYEGGTVINLRRRDTEKESYYIYIDLSVDKFLVRFKQSLKKCK
jgi:hypothetical protein